MKLILVPVDFSATSLNALKYAIALGQTMNSKIVCLHAFHYSENINESFDMVKDEVLQQMDQHIREAGDGNDLPDVERIAYPGTLVDSVRTMVQNLQADLLLMGTKGATGLKKVLVGSHATDVLSGTTIPLMVIPEQCTYERLQTMMLASDFKFMPNDNALDVVIELAKAHDAEIRIAHVNTGKKHTTYEEHIERGREHHLFGDDVKHAFKNIRSTDISKGIRYYLDLKGDHDLLIMIRREHGFMDKLFRTDHAYDFACQPKLPLLIVHE